MSISALKKCTILVYALVLLTGYAMADPGVSATFETQGVVTSTTVNGDVNFLETADVTWSISSEGIITSGTDPTLAEYPNWDSYPYGGGYEQWLLDWESSQTSFPGFTLQDLNDYNQQYFPGDPFTLFITDLVSWAEQQSVGGLNSYLRDNEVRYTAAYASDTQSNGIGSLAYAKTTRLETKGLATGQYNIEATKQIAYQGYDGAEITSTDNIFLDGTGNEQTTAEKAICVFASDKSSTIPRFCNTVEAGSSFTGELVDMETTTNTRFVTSAADYPVVLNHNIRVDARGGVPSQGKVSAFMEGLIQEAMNPDRISYDIGGEGAFLNASGIHGSLKEEIEFSEETGVDGKITLFDKRMGWESGIRR